MWGTFAGKITCVHGLLHYLQTQLTWRISLLLFFFVFLPLVGSGVAIWSLSNQLAQVDERRAHALEQYARLLKKNGSLLQAVGQKTDELDYLSDELHYLKNDLTGIEVLIGKPDSAVRDASISERLDTAAHTVLERTTFLQNVPSGYPLRNEGVTSRFGWRKHPVYEDRRFHTGIDLRAPVGTPIVAPADGVVQYAGFHKNSGFGNLIILTHNFGFQTYFAHLDEFAVRPGQFVRKGTVIGTSGNTGVTSGPHLHYEIWHIEGRLDPKPFLNWSLANYNEIFELETSVQWEGLEQAIRLRLNGQGFSRITLRE